MLFSTDKLIIANWKMNGSAAEIEKYLNYIKLGKTCQERLVIALPNLYLKEVAEKIKANDKNIFIAAQDVSANANGAYTGETSASMLADCQIAYSLIGHSERRRHHNLKREAIVNSISQCHNYDIIPIICCGENTMLEYNDNIFLENEIDHLLSGVEKNKDIILAYEPAWAIGTGIVPSYESIENKASFLYKLLNKLNFFSVTILYGGSIDSSNYNSILDLPSVNGALIGKACLNPETFCAMINSHK